MTSKKFILLLQTKKFIFGSILFWCLLFSVNCQAQRGRYSPPSEAEIADRAGYTRYTVSTDGITRIHDLINDQTRNRIIGITRSDTALNYVFTMDRDGVITKQQTAAGTGDGRGMEITWGEGSVWGAMYETTNQLIKVNPETLAITEYQITASSLPSACLAYNNNGYIFIGGFITAENSPIYRFNISTETFDTYTATDIRNLYWALFDGTDCWFAGEDPDTSQAEIVRIEEDGTITNYELGVTGGHGAEIEYDGRYIWYGGNDIDELYRFDTYDSSVDTIHTMFAPRVIGFDSKKLWMANETLYAAIDVESMAIERAGDIAGIAYVHGLTFDKENVYVGTWADTCYIWKLPKRTFQSNPFSMIVAGGSTAIAYGDLPKYADTTEWIDTEATAQIPMPGRFVMYRISVNITANTLNGTLGLGVYADSDLVEYFTIAATNTGVIVRDEPEDGTPIIAKGDLLSIKAFNGTATSGSVTLGKVTVMGTLLY